MELCDACSNEPCICGNPRAQLQAQTVERWEWLITDGVRQTRGITSSWDFANRVVARWVKDHHGKLSAASGRNRNVESVYRTPNGQEIRATVRRVQEVEL